jgi:hypothetical protein
MNLHQIRGSTTKWIWIRMYGGNGRFLGNHAYEIEQGIPQVLEFERPMWANQYWEPNRFEWRAFRDALYSLFANGYVRPLCGHSSRARFLDGRFATYSGCGNCTRIADTRGIIIYTHQDAVSANPTQQAITAERATWRELNPI